MKVKNDHHSKFSNLSKWKEEAWKKKQRNLYLSYKPKQLYGPSNYQDFRETSPWLARDWDIVADGIVFQFKHAN